MGFIARSLTLHQQLDVGPHRQRGRYCGRPAQSGDRSPGDRPPGGQENDTLHAGKMSNCWKMRARPKFCARCSTAPPRHRNIAASPPTSSARTPTRPSRAFSSTGARRRGARGHANRGGARGLVGQVYRVTNNAAQVACWTETPALSRCAWAPTRATGMLRRGSRCCRRPSTGSIFGATCKSASW